MSNNNSNNYNNYLGQLIDDTITNMYDNGLKRFNLGHSFFSDKDIDTYLKDPRIFAALLEYTDTKASQETQVKVLVMCFHSSTVLTLLMQIFSKAENELLKDAIRIKEAFQDLFRSNPILNDLLNAYLGLNADALFNSNNTGTVVQDAHNRQSPFSRAGKIYEFNRGVIAIYPDGTIRKENIDNKWLFNGMFMRHPYVTWAIVNNKDLTLRSVQQEAFELLEVQKKFSPYELGMQASDKGIVLIQLEGDGITSFLPEKMSYIQAASLFAVLAPRQKFISHFCHNGVPYDDDESVSFLQNKCIEILSSSIKGHITNKSTAESGPSRAA